MNKGAVALLALVAMACVSGPAVAAKKAPALSVEKCKAFLAAEEAKGASAAVAVVATKKPAAMSVDSCKAFVAAEEKKAADLQAYRDGFKEAVTAVDFQLFVDMFSGNDPDKLVPVAKAKIKELQAAEAAAAAAEAAAPAAQ